MQVATSRSLHFLLQDKPLPTKMLNPRIFIVKILSLTNQKLICYVGGNVSSLRKKKQTTDYESVGIQDSISHLFITYLKLKLCKRLPVHVLH